MCSCCAYSVQRPQQHKYGRSDENLRVFENRQHKGAQRDSNIIEIIKNYIRQMREPILMRRLPGQARILFSLPTQSGWWYNMNDVSLFAQDTKLKLPVSYPSWRHETLTSACVQLSRQKPTVHRFNQQMLRNVTINNYFKHISQKTPKSKNTSKSNMTYILYGNGMLWSHTQVKIMETEETSIKGRMWKCI